jgi:GT2 family glycosyltransferase
MSPAPLPPEARPWLSVVIIGRNEERFLARCLRSVLTAAAEIGGAEILMVDSDSTDRTVEIAQSFGVRVLSLRPEWPKSAAAGRYIGFHHTRGELILFIDADTEIKPGFLPRAAQAFREPDVAGVAGYHEDADEQGRLTPVGRHSEQVIELAWLRGACALYRREALEQAGPFNPHLTAEEEAELAIRLRKRGWRLLQLPYPMACHLRGWYTPASLIRGWKIGRLTSLGIALRHAWLAGIGWDFLCLRLKQTMLFTLAGLAFSIGGGTALARSSEAGSALLICLLAGFAAIAIKKRSLRGPFIYLTTHLWNLADILVGFLATRAQAPHTYPLNAIEKTIPSALAAPAAARDAHR